MNKLTFLIATILLIAGCSKTYYVNDIIAKNEKHSRKGLKYLVNDNYYFTNGVPIYSAKKNT